MRYIISINNNTTNSNTNIIYSNFLFYRTTLITTLIIHMLFFCLFLLSMLQFLFSYFKDTHMLNKNNNKPIQDLIKEYENENSDFNDLNWVSKSALRYVDSLPDSQVRCFLYILANHHLNS